MNLGVVGAAEESEVGRDKVRGLNVVFAFRRDLGEYRTASESVDVDGWKVIASVEERLVFEAVFRFCSDPFMSVE
jgi:hypothetical protein